MKRSAIRDLASRNTSPDFASLHQGYVTASALTAPPQIPKKPAKPLKDGQRGPATACAVIVKRVDEHTRAKTSINELLRD
jgi:tetrahydrodipicolinate N-succinyltransferase